MIFQRLGRVMLSNSVDTPSRVCAGVKPQGEVCVPEQLSERGIVSATRFSWKILVSEAAMLTYLRKDILFPVSLLGERFGYLPSSTGKKLDTAARDRRKSFSDTINLLQGLFRTQAGQVSSGARVHVNS